MNREALADPRTLGITAQRFAKLYEARRGRIRSPRPRPWCVTLERCLNQGNVAIFADIGGAGTCTSRGDRPSARYARRRVLAEFSRPAPKPEEARLAYAYALAHAQDVPRPADFGRLLPGVSWEEPGGGGLRPLRAGPAPRARSVRDALIGMANNYLAYQEQSPRCSPPSLRRSARPDEVSRPR